MVLCTKPGDSATVATMAGTGIIPVLLTAVLFPDESVEWHQLKTHEIAGRMFEDEYDSDCCHTRMMEARSKQGGYPLERFKFNSG